MGFFFACSQKDIATSTKVKVSINWWVEHGLLPASNFWQNENSPSSGGKLVHMCYSKRVRLQCNISPRHHAKEPDWVFLQVSGRR